MLWIRALFKICMKLIFANVKPVSHQEIDQLTFEKSFHFNPLFSANDMLFARSAFLGRPFNALQPIAVIRTIFISRKSRGEIACLFSVYVHAFFPHLIFCIKYSYLHCFNGAQHLHMKKWNIDDVKLTLSIVFSKEFRRICIIQEL